MKRAILMAFPFAAALPAAASESEAQLWTNINFSAPVEEGLTLSLEAQSRWTDDVRRMGQLLVRPSISLALGDHSSLAIGYAYVRTDPEGPALTEEHRTWQQMSYRISGDGKGVTVTGRSRLEQRWVAGRDGTGWRLRQQVRLTAPVGNEVRLALSSEAFVGLNDSGWGQQPGIDRWRNGAGIVIPLSDGISIEPAYINQWVNRPGPNLVNHIASIGLAMRF